MRDANPCLVAVVVAVLVLLAADRPSAQVFPDPTKVMITEVSWDEPDGVELTSFEGLPTDLTGWRIRWKDAAGTTLSAPLNVQLVPGEILVVLEQSPALVPELLPGIQVITPLPPLATGSESFVVALENPMGVIVDEVLVSDTAGGTTTSISGSFRGFARRGTLAPSLSIERIWGLDSDGGRDWTEETARGFGLQSQSGGARNGQDPVPVREVWINEIDDDPDCIEVVNRSGSPVDLKDWYFVMTNIQDGPLWRVLPWPGSFVVGPGEMAVVYEGMTPPPEMPAATAAVSVPIIGLTSNELTVGLIDPLGRLVDLVRACRVGTDLAHNHPRIPSWPFDFTGAAPRHLAGDGAIGRASQTLDTNSGGDWKTVATRSMGLPNTDFVGGAGHAHRLDVRLNEGAGDGLTVIINAGTPSALHTYSFFFSLGHRQGTGSFFGLGPEALTNWFLLSALPPFSGTLNHRGAARFDFPAGSLPPGFEADCIFLVQEPTGILSKLTLILELDT